jgi:hypothetical protein
LARARTRLTCAPMIARVDDYLEAVMTAALKGRKVAISFESPPETPTGRDAVLSLLLYDVREELDRRGGDGEDIWKDDRRVGHRPPDRYYRLRYLITARAKDVRDEHQILGDLVENLPVPPFGRDATGMADPDEEPIVVEIALPIDVGGPSITDVWSALGVAPRASLDLHAITRVRGGEVIAGPPVEHLVLDVERLDTAGVVKPGATKIVRKWSSTKVEEHRPK